MKKSNQGVNQRYLKERIFKNPPENNSQNVVINNFNNCLKRKTVSKSNKKDIN